MKNSDRLDEEIKKYTKLLYGTFFAGLIFVALEISSGYPIWEFLAEVAKYGCVVFGVIAAVKNIIKYEKNKKDRE